MGMPQTEASLLKEKLRKDEMKTLFHIYIGQNIREYGILKDDSYLEEMSSIVESLIRKGVVEERHWYKFNTLRISNKYMVALKEICEKELKNIKKKLQSDFSSIPSIILSFLVFECLTEDISYSTEKPDWFLDWADVLLANDKIHRYKSDFFNILMNHGVCVKTNSYVSTRGGQLRDKEFVITAEVRKFLTENTQHLQIPPFIKDRTIIFWEILNQVESEARRTVELSIRDDYMSEIVSDFDTATAWLEKLISRMSTAGLIYESKRIPGFGWEFRSDKKSTSLFVRNDVTNAVVDQLLSEKVKLSKAQVEKKESFLNLVQTMVTKKFAVYRIAAQFGGKEIFKSLPHMEVCILNLATPRSDEEGLKNYIADLHQILEESSRKEVLKFRDGEAYVSLEDWLEIKIPDRASSLYENAKEFFRDLNRLRNFYSHALNAEGIFQTGLIFNKLIGKYSPDKEDITNTQVILLERATRALDSLYHVLELAWHERTGRGI